MLRLISRREVALKRNIVVSSTLIRSSFLSHKTDPDQKLRKVCRTGHRRLRQLCADQESRAQAACQKSRESRKTKCQVQVFERLC